MNLDEFFESVAANGSKQDCINIEVAIGRARLFPLVVNVLTEDDEEIYIRVYDGERHIYNQVVKAANDAGFEVVCFTISYGKIFVEAVKKDTSPNAADNPEH